MVTLKLILILTAGPMFLTALSAHIFVKIKLRPKDDSDFDEYHYEFEDHFPGFEKYTKWSHITFTAAVVSALLLFIAVVL